MNLRDKRALIALRVKAQEYQPAMTAFLCDLIRPYGESTEEAAAAR